MNNADEYITVNELSTRIKFAKRSIYNMIWQKKFIEGTHYIKPSPRKVLFKWNMIRSWLVDDVSNEGDCT